MSSHFASLFKHLRDQFDNSQWVSAEYHNLPIPANSAFYPAKPLTPCGKPLSNAQYTLDIKGSMLDNLFFSELKFVSYTLDLQEFAVRKTSLSQDMVILTRTENLYNNSAPIVNFGEHLQVNSFILSVATFPIIMTFGTVTGNILVLIAVSLSNGHPTKLLIANLAVADLLVGEFVHLFFALHSICSFSLNRVKGSPNLGILI